MEENNQLPENALEMQSSGIHFKYFPFFNHKQAVFVLVLIGLIFYSTSLYNEYALDDAIIIHQNDDVLKGARGIKNIMSSDVYANFYRRMNASDQLTGGRYRPLSIVSFALEQEVIGTYRSGFYDQVEDLNKNGKLDEGPVSYTVQGQQDESTSALTTNQKVIAAPPIVQSNYEYNAYVDANADGKAQTEECYHCWDLNKNFKNDASEDLNKDGVFNEIDCQVKGAFLRHTNNVLLYELLIVLIYILCKSYFFKQQHDLAFLVALLFAVHPLHTEVVANVKSRDDIFSLMFIVLAFIMAFKFVNNKKTGHLLLFAIVSFLALLSKEYAVLMPLLLPIALYVFDHQSVQKKSLLLLYALFVGLGALMLVLAIKQVFAVNVLVFINVAALCCYLVGAWLLIKRDAAQKTLLTLMLSLHAVTLIYFIIRLAAVNMVPGVVDSEILNNPFWLASGQEAFATKIYVLLDYFRLLIFPHPLVCDYSFDSIKYKQLSDVSVILSMLLYVVMIIMCWRLIKKRHATGFAILLFLVFLLPISNFIFPIGATMAERLLFHSSLGFAIALAWMILKGIDALSAWSIKMKRTFLMSSLTLIVFLYGCKTWERNWDWKNDVTLFLKDVKNAPNSVLILGNAGARWIDLADTKEITGVTPPGQDSSIVNDYNGQLKITDDEVKSGGFKNKREAALQRGIGYLKHAIELHPRYVNGYLNLGLAEFKLGHDDKAIYYWENARFLYPDNPYLKLYYNVYGGILKQRAEEAMGKANTNEAVKQLRYLIVIARENSEPWYLLASAFKQMNELNKAKNCLSRAKQIDPKDEATNKALQEWFDK